MGEDDSFLLFEVETCYFPTKAKLLLRIKTGFYCFQKFCTMGRTVTSDRKLAVFQIMNNSACLWQQKYTGRPNKEQILIGQLTVTALIK